MATVDITREHNLGKEKAKEQAQLLADKLAQKLDAKCAWQGDVLTFKRRCADGTVHVSDSDGRAVVTLGLLVTPYAGLGKGWSRKGGAN